MNMFWILVLTLYPNSHNGPTSVEHIPLFQSQEACMKAGELWLSKKPVYETGIGQKYSYVVTSAICVPSK